MATDIIPEGVIGAAPTRIEGAAKVTGVARYGADGHPPHVAHAALRTAAIGRGKVLRVDQTAARALPGVLDVLTHAEVGHAIKPGKWILDGGAMGTRIAPLSTDRVHHGGQIVAMVVAETYEAARDGALALVVDYAPDEPATGFDSPRAAPAKPQAMGEVEVAVGDVEAGLAAAAASIDVRYQTPAQHHNPLELFQTTCAWDGPDLTVWESSQNVRGYQRGLAKQLGIAARHVRVVSPLIGGAFGSRGELGQMTAIVAFAAKRLGRPVKLVATRQQGFAVRTFRAETRHHMRLGATADGRLTALSHESWEAMARTEHFAIAGSESTARLYACPNVHAKVNGVEMDRQAPGFMRAPPETPYMFAMESAMDELAHALGIDPLDLRRRNDTRIDPVKGLPYTSRALVECIDAGAGAFGWDRRTAEPGSMREGNELVGYGYATAFYPAQIGPASARVTLSPNLTARVEIGTHEIGTGVSTVLAQVVADRLGVPIEAVDVVIGDSDLPAAPMSAGSNTTASVSSVVALACEELRGRVIKAATGARHGPLHGQQADFVRFYDSALHAGGASEPLGAAVRRAGRGKPLVANTSHNPHGAPPVVGPALVARGVPVMVGGSHMKDRLQFAFGAQFVEVRVDRDTGAIRVPRMVGAFAAGRIMNPRTAESQLKGGMIWGIGAALLEASEMDARAGRWVNNDLAEYHVAVNADVGRVDVLMLPEEDAVINPLGIKGVGEIGITGVNAAIANAVFHATGVRVRELPIRLDALLNSPLLA